MTLDEFMASQNWELLRVANGWSVKREGDLLYFTLSAPDGERFRLRLLCDGYPGTAPSVVFVDDAGSSMTPTAWPKGGPRFLDIVKPPPSSFLCMPLIREGLQHHGEWRSDASKNPWSGERHSLLDVFNVVQRLLEQGDYGGRGP